MYYVVCYSQLNVKEALESLMYHRKSRLSGALSGLHFAEDASSTSSINPSESKGFLDF